MLYWVSQVVQTVKNLPETQVLCLNWEVPLKKGMAVHSVFLSGESHGQRSLGVTDHGVTKSWTRLSD